VHVRHELAIARSPDDVFAYLADPRNLPQWQRSVVRVEVTDPVAVGSRFTEERSQLGRIFRSTIEITELEQDRRFSIRVVDGPMPARIEHALEPDGGGTKLTVHAEAELDRLPKALRFVVGRRIENELAGDFIRLQELLEEPPARDHGPG
jgi:uncharacterized protein YndB with AHSA1/START domain